MRKVTVREDAREICADGTRFPNNLRRRVTTFMSLHNSFLMLELTRRTLQRELRSLFSHTKRGQ